MRAGSSGGRGERVLEGKTGSLGTLSRVPEGCIDMPMGLLKPIVQEKEWRVQGLVNDVRSLVKTTMDRSGFSVEEEDTSLEGAPYSGVALHQKVKIGMTYGSMAHRSEGGFLEFGRAGAKTGAAKLGETNRLHLWYYPVGPNTVVHARGTGMEKNLSEAFAALESSFGARAAPAPATAH